MKSRRNGMGKFGSVSAIAVLFLIALKCTECYQVPHLESPSPTGLLPLYDSVQLHEATRHDHQQQQPGLKAVTRLSPAPSSTHGEPPSRRVKRSPGGAATSASSKILKKVSEAGSSSSPSSSSSTEVGSNALSVESPHPQPRSMFNDTEVRFHNSEERYQQLALQNTWYNHNSPKPGPMPVVEGLRIETSGKGVSYEHGGVSVVQSNVETTVRLFGKYFTNATIIRFATEVRNKAEDCDDSSATTSYPVTGISQTGYTALITVSLPASKVDEFYYICVRENNTGMDWIHQGPEPWLRIKVYDKLLPFWLQGVLIVVLLLLSGLFAGLTLGLLALDRTDLKILANTGSDKERQYAKTILPLRTKGNYLLCSLVLGNVLVNSTLTILLDDLTTGVFAVMLSTAGIVIFGEIIPQAFCSRNGLAIGAKTVWVTKFIMLITFPLSYTFSVILDKILGEEIGIVYNREKLKELIAVTLEHNQLETDEVNIISGALEMRKKTVESIMTRLEDVFMLPIDGILDFESLSEVRRQGYSRIPIYDGDRNNIVSILFTKDLVFVDPDDRIPLRTLAEFYKNTLYFIFADTTLDIVFREFKGCRRGGHMAFVQRVVNNDENKDPYCETIGLVTLEDVIEEMIQAEIVDETDVWMDNRSKKRVAPHSNQDFSKFVEIRNSQKTIAISPQLALAAFQFLSTVVEPFTSKHISESILHRLLKKNVIFKIAKSKEEPSNVMLYEIGKPVDYFILILEGRVEVTTGLENLMFETGSFTYFGIPALLSPADNEFTPDYTVRLITDCIVLRIRRSLYQAAVQATMLEKAKSTCDPGKDGQQEPDPSIEEQIERVLRTVDNSEYLQHQQQLPPPPPLPISIFNSHPSFNIVNNNAHAKLELEV